MVGPAWGHRAGAPDREGRRAEGEDRTTKRPPGQGVTGPGATGPGGQRARGHRAEKAVRPRGPLSHRSPDDHRTGQATGPKAARLAVVPARVYRAAAPDRERRRTEGEDRTGKGRRARRPPDRKGHQATGAIERPAAGRPPGRKTQPDRRPPGRRSSRPGSAGREHRIGKSTGPRVAAPVVVPARVYRAAAPDRERRQAEREDRTSKDRRARGHRAEKAVRPRGRRTGTTTQPAQPPNRNNHRPGTPPDRRSRRSRKPTAPRTATAPRSAASAARAPPRRGRAPGAATSAGGRSGRTGGPRPPSRRWRRPRPRPPRRPGPRRGG